MKRFMIGCVAIVCVVAGCGGSKDAGPTPVTSTMGTPSAGAPSTSVGPSNTSSAPSSPTSPVTQSPSASAQDVEDAKKLYLAYETTLQKWEIAGGSATLPTDVGQYLADPIRTNVQQLLALQKAKGWRLADHPTPHIRIYGTLPTSLNPGALMALHTCIDATHTPISGDGTITHGVVVEYREFFKKVDGALKYYATQNRKVAACPAG